MNIFNITNMKLQWVFLQLLVKIIVPSYHNLWLKLPSFLSPALSWCLGLGIDKDSIAENLTIQYELGIAIFTTGLPT